MICVLGIDPGKSGAFAFLFPEPIGFGRAAVFDLPYVGADLDGAALADAIAQFDPALAIVEQQWPRQEDSKPNAFRTARNYGAILGVLQGARVPIEIVSPQKWKKATGVGSDKEASRALALSRWPAIAERFRFKKNEGRAEACLIARYGAEAFRSAEAA